MAGGIAAMTAVTRTAAAAVRRLARWALRVCEAALAAVALAALVAWPRSCLEQAVVQGVRTFAGDDRVTDTYVGGGWYGGRVAVSWTRVTFSGDALDYARPYADSKGPEWRWTPEPAWVDFDGEADAGPLHWTWDDVERGPGKAASKRVASLPCWLLALAGTWPAGSALLFVRRHRRAARWARTNCCRRCGHDLRATPAADGATLPVCPECGTRGRERGTQGSSD